jgi:polyisoprenyl-phosphate glycosyltransferase
MVSNVRINPNLAIVIPCYNEQDVLPITVDIMLQKVRELVGKGAIKPDSQIYFVDDGSKDQTWSLIETYTEKYKEVRGIKLSRNQGHQNALLAGLLTAEGDILVSIDADLQDDIAVIDNMIDCYANGCDVVYAARAKRETDTRFKRFTAEMYYSLMNKMGVNIVYNHADYRLLSRKAIDSLRSFSEVNLFLRGIVPLIGFKSDTVFYDRAERAAGESKYPIAKMLAFAIQGITSFSYVPLRMITFLGFSVSAFAFAMIFWVGWIKFFTETAVPGWASILIPMFFLGGVQLLSLGVIGEYIAKTYMETKRRPPFFIEKVV